MHRERLACASTLAKLDLKVEIAAQVYSRPALRLALCLGGNQTVWQKLIEATSSLLHAAVKQHTVGYRNHCSTMPTTTLCFNVGLVSLMIFAPVLALVTPSELPSCAVSRKPDVTKEDPS
jgi:hypothetical protein